MSHTYLYEEVDSLQLDVEHVVIIEDSTPVAEMNAAELMALKRLSASPVKAGICVNLALTPR